MFVIKRQMGNSRSGHTYGRQLDHSTKRTISGEGPQRSCLKHPTSMNCARRAWYIVWVLFLRGPSAGNSWFVSAVVGSCLRRKFSKNLTTSKDIEPWKERTGIAKDECYARQFFAVSSAFVASSNITRKDVKVRIVTSQNNQHKKSL